MLDHVSCTNFARNLEASIALSAYGAVVYASILLGAALYAGASVDRAGSSACAGAVDRRRIFRHLPGPAIGHGLDGGCLGSRGRGPEAKSLVGAGAGRCLFFGLARKLRFQPRPVELGGLHHPPGANGADWRRRKTSEMIRLCRWRKRVATACRFFSTGTAIGAWSFFVGPGSRKQALRLALPKDLPDQSYSGNCSKIRNGAQKTWVPEVQDFTKGDTKVIASSPLRECVRTSTVTKRGSRTCGYSEQHVPLAD